MSLTAGDNFAGYTILRLLGSGGMGEVYLAQHPRLPRQDALKILRPDVSDDPDFRQRFIREADLAAALSHPNIVTVHDRGEADGKLWVATEYVDGTDSAQLLRDRYPAGMPADEVSIVVSAIASALDYAHDRGLLHRDVKPANILLSQPDRDGRRRAFLADFGIARELADPNGLTATNLTVGTVAYGAPEQLMGSEIDGRADEYALAASAFHLLTGTPPFQDSNPVAVISQHLTAAPPKLSDRRTDLAALDEVLSVALAKAPEGRFQRVSQFAKALTECIPAGSNSDHATQAAITPPLARNEHLESGNKRRRHRLIVAAAVAAVLLTALGIIGFNAKLNTPSTPTAAVSKLDGTYRLEYLSAQQTTMGSPSPPAATDPQSETVWVAFRSTCTSTGCVATGTSLDDKNQQIASTPSKTSEYHFIEDQWQRLPRRTPVQHQACSVVDDTEVPGSDTGLVTVSLRPQPDGTLRGAETLTILTSECGSQGLVRQTPILATRTGDTPPKVLVADPAAVVSTAATNTPKPVSPGPVLDGMYRVDYNYAQTTANGVPHPEPDKSVWWAFRSSCTSTGCAATGAQLDTSNHQEATSISIVLQFNQGRWQNVPEAVRLPCAGMGPNPQGIRSRNTVAKAWSWEPQTESVLKGVSTIEVRSNECGLGGLSTVTPILATRIGDVPPAVALADPRLFS